MAICQIYPRFIFFSLERPLVCVGGLPAAQVCAVVLLNSLCDIRQRQEHHSVSVLLASTAHRLPSSATPTPAHSSPRAAEPSHASQTFRRSHLCRANMCGHECARKSWLYHRSVLLISALSRTPPFPTAHEKQGQSRSLVH